MSRLRKKREIQADVISLTCSPTLSGVLIFNLESLLLGCERGQRDNSNSVLFPRLKTLDTKMTFFYWHKRSWQEVFYAGWPADTWVRVEIWKVTSCWWCWCQRWRSFDSFKYNLKAYKVPRKLITYWVISWFSSRDNLCSYKQFSRNQKLFTSQLSKLYSKNSTLEIFQNQPGHPAPAVIGDEQCRQDTEKSERKWKEMIYVLGTFASEEREIM